MGRERGGWEEEKGMRGRKENFFICMNVGNRLTKERTDFCLFGQNVFEEM